jgi:hypothetical protein
MLKYNVNVGRAVARAVSRRLPIAEARDRSRGQVHVGFVAYKVELGQFFLRVLRFPSVNFIPPVLHYTEKTKKTNYLLHNKPQGCSVSVASAAGPFKKNSGILPSK